VLDCSCSFASRLANKGNEKERGAKTNDKKYFSTEFTLACKNALSRFHKKKILWLELTNSTWFKKCLEYHQVVLFACGCCTNCAADG